MEPATLLCPGDRPLDISDDIASPISPELALVDLELAVLARARLPEPPDCLTVRPAEPSLDRVAETPAHRHRRRALGGALMAGAWVAFAGIVASPLLAFLPPRRAPTVDYGVLAPRSAPAVGEAVERPARTGETLRWPAAPGASSYNLILVRGSQRVDYWTTMPHVSITRPVPIGAPLAPAVSYSWFVYPAFRVSSSDLRYGAVIAHGSVSAHPGTLRGRAGAAVTVPVQLQKNPAARPIERHANGVSATP